MRLLILAGGLAVAGIHAAPAEIHLVLPDGSGDYPTIQAAIDAAAEGDVVELADGTFVGEGNRDLYLWGKAITVRSQSGNPEACVIDCEGEALEPHRGFNLTEGESEATVLEKITIRGGYDVSEGGGMTIRYTSPTIRGCILTGNHGGNAGGMLIGGTAAPEIQECRFEMNTAGFGGGGLVTEGPSSPTLADCVFEANHSDNEGGALCVYDSATPILTRCFFHANTADRQGSGLVVDHYCNPVTCDQCTFVGNIGPGGSASVCGHAYGVFTSCTFEGNQSSIDAAGLFCSCQATTSVSRCIFAFSLEGSGIYCSEDAEMTLSCCDSYGNAGGDWVGAIADQLGVNGNICADPLFCDASQGDLTLHIDSPCAPFSPPNEACDLIGAWPVACPAATVDEPPAGRRLGWGEVKALFRGSEN